MFKRKGIDKGKKEEVHKKDLHKHDSSKESSKESSKPIASKPKEVPFVPVDFSKMQARPERVVASKERRSKPIAYALKELKRAVFEIVFCICWLDCLIVFMLFILVFKLVSVPWYWTVVPTVIYAVLHTWSRLKKASNYGYIEERVPELSEKISTVADNLGRDNLVIQELNEDVLEGMHLIRTSYFFSFGRLSRELIVLTVLAFLITGVSAYGVKFIDFHKVINDVSDLRIFSGEYDVNSDLLQYEENLSDDIYGEKSIAALGNQLLNLQINPTLSDVDISKIRDPEQRKFRSSVPVEISAQTDSSFEDSIPKSYQKIVKNYFKDISKAG